MPEIGAVRLAARAQRGTLVEMTRHDPAPREDSLALIRHPSNHP